VPEQIEKKNSSALQIFFEDLQVADCECDTSMHPPHAPNSDGEPPVAKPM
jgi:hypothetical protein